MSNEHLLQQTLFESLQFGNLVYHSLKLGIHCGKRVSDFSLLVGVRKQERQFLEIPLRDPQDRNSLSNPNDLPPHWLTA
jgi:hypothetical protein